MGNCIKNIQKEPPQESPLVKAKKCERKSYRQNTSTSL